MPVQIMKASYTLELFLPGGKRIGEHDKTAGYSPLWAVLGIAMIALV